MSQTGETMDEINLFTRRNLFVAGATGGLALAALSLVGTASAMDELTETEKANVAVVDAFHKDSCIDRNSFSESSIEARLCHKAGKWRLPFNLMFL